MQPCGQSWVSKHFLQLYEMKLLNTIFVIKDVNEVASCKVMIEQLLVLELFYNFDKTIKNVNFLFKFSF